MDQHREGSPPADSICLDVPLDALSDAVKITMMLTAQFGIFKTACGSVPPETGPRDAKGPRTCLSATQRESAYQQKLWIFTHRAVGAVGRRSWRSRSIRIVSAPKQFTQHHVSAARCGNTLSRPSASSALLI